MKILSRYLIKTYLAITSTCLAAFVSIYLVIDFLERYAKFSRAGAANSDIFLYFICKTPEILFQTTPMAVLMGTILTIGTLSKNSEITAMRSSGASLLQIGKPLLAIATTISLSLLFMQEFITPLANEKMNYLEEVVIKKNGKAAFFRRNNIWHKNDNLILQAKLFNPDTSTLSGITIWETDKGTKPLARTDATSATPAQGGWQLHEVTKRAFTASGVVQSNVQEYMFVKIDLGTADLKDAAQAVDDMGFTALYRYVANLRDNGFDTTPYITLLHSKISLPFAAVVMAFMGIPFSLRDGRSAGMGAGIVFSIMIGFSYFIINSLLISLGQAGAIYPLIAAWTANIIFAAAGLWFTLTVDG
ncbi:MAG: LPS export ABC transporter permease LptG [Geobacteraceae bacterium]|nr:LPS export ABC transporter permease LptG [Geobacteraceae bacterium]